MSFEARVDAGTSAQVLCLARWIAAQRWDGVLDVVPALNAVAVYVSPEAARSGQVERSLARAVAEPWDEPITEGPLVEIAVSYGGGDGPDLLGVANEVGLPPDEVVRRHCSVTYRVFMLGFLPGFPYLGVVDPSIQVPRHSAPRTRVAAGSVGLAGAQTGIYPRESPGGWQIIGRTPARLFDVTRTPPARLMPGDRVRFVPTDTEREGA